MKQSFKVEVRVDEQGNEYPFIDFGADDHRQPTLRLWIQKRFLDDSGIIRFPVRDATIEKAPGGTYILRYSPGKIVYHYYQMAGDGGEADFEVLKPTDAGVIKYAKEVYGTDRGALITTSSDSIMIKWWRTGHTHGLPKEGVEIITVDGETRAFNGLVDNTEGLDELRKLIE